MFNPQDEQDEDDCFVFLNLDMALISNSLFKHFFPCHHHCGGLYNRNKILRDCPPYQLTKKAMLDSLVLVDFAIGKILESRILEFGICKTDFLCTLIPLF